MDKPPRSAPNLLQLPLWLAAVGVVLVSVLVVAQLHHLRDTTGKATFHPTGGLLFNAGEAVELTLPADWKSVYNGHQPFREATLLDVRGEAQFEVTVDLFDFSHWGPDVRSLEQVTQLISDRHRAKGWSTRMSPGQTPRGPLWGVMSKTSTPEHIFLAGREWLPRPSQGLYLQFYEVWNGRVLASTFRTRADHAEVLEPLARELMQGARLSRTER